MTGKKLLLRCICREKDAALLELQYRVTCKKMYIRFKTHLGQKILKKKKVIIKVTVTHHQGAYLNMYI